jgi:hypothetical protein
MSKNFYVPRVKNLKFDHLLGVYGTLPFAYTERILQLPKGQLFLDFLEIFVHNLNKIKKPINKFKLQDITPPPKKKKLIIIHNSTLNKMNRKGFLVLGKYILNHG